MAVLFLPPSAVVASTDYPYGSHYEIYILPVIVGSEGELEMRNLKLKTMTKVFMAFLI